MNRADLRSFATRTGALLEASPPSTIPEVRSWIAEPLLSTLGWTPSGDGGDDRACRYAADVTIDLGDRDGGSEDVVELEYLCAVGATPAVFVRVRAPDDPIDDQPGGDLRRAMTATGVDRGIETDGRHLRLLAGRDGSDRFRCDLRRVEDHADALVHVSASNARRRLAGHSRPLAARRLAVRRAGLADSIASELSAVGGDAYADEFETAAQRFVDDLVRSLAPSEPAIEPGTRAQDGEGAAALDSESGAPAEPATARRTGRFDTDGAPVSDPTDRTAESGSSPQPNAGARSESDASDPRTTDGVDRREADPGASIANADEPDANERERSTSVERRPAGETDEDGDTDSPLAVHTDRNPTGGEAEADDRTDGDGEYVVRFFDGRDSIAAIGHSRPETAAADAAEFLIERDLEGASLPVAVEDDTVLDDRPVGGDGSPMPAYRQLSNGAYLNTAGSDADLGARIEALASRAGLRVMLTGDWPSDDRERE